MVRSTASSQQGATTTPQRQGTAQRQVVLPPQHGHGATSHGGAGGPQTASVGGLLSAFIPPLAPFSLAPPGQWSVGPPPPVGGPPPPSYAPAFSGGGSPLPAVLAAADHGDPLLSLQSTCALQQVSDPVVLQQLQQELAGLVQHYHALCFSQKEGWKQLEAERQQVLSERAMLAGEREAVRVTGLAGMQACASMQANFVESQKRWVEMMQCAVCGQHMEERIMQPVGVVPQEPQLPALEHQALVEQQRNYFQWRDNGTPSPVERPPHFSCWGRASGDAKEPGGAEPSGGAEPGAPGSPFSEVTRSPGSVASSALRRGQRPSPLEELGEDVILASSSPVRIEADCDGRARLWAIESDGMMDRRQIKSEPATPSFQVGTPGGRAGHLRVRTGAEEQECSSSAARRGGPSDPSVPTWTEPPPMSPGSALGTGDTGGTPVSASRGAFMRTLLADSFSASLVLTEEPSDESPEEFRASSSTALSRATSTRSRGTATSQTSHASTQTPRFGLGESPESVEADTQTPSVVDFDMQTQTTASLWTDASTQTTASLLTDASTQLDESDRLAAKAVDATMQTEPDPAKRKLRENFRELQKRSSAAVEELKEELQAKATQVKELECQSKKFLAKMIQMSTWSGTNPDLYEDRVCEIARGCGLQVEDHARRSSAASSSRVDGPRRPASPRGADSSGTGKGEVLEKREEAVPEVVGQGHVKPKSSSKKKRSQKNAEESEDEVDKAIREIAEEDRAKQARSCSGGSSVDVLPIPDHSTMVDPRSPYPGRPNPLLAPRSRGRRGGRPPLLPPTAQLVESRQLVEDVADKLEQDLEEVDDRIKETLAGTEDVEQEMRDFRARNEQHVFWLQENVEALFRKRCALRDFYLGRGAHPDAPPPLAEGGGEKVPVLSLSEREQCYRQCVDQDAQESSVVGQQLPPPSPFAEDLLLSPGLSSSSADTEASAQTNVDLSEDRDRFAAEIISEQVHLVGGQDADVLSRTWSNKTLTPLVSPFLSEPVSPCSLLCGGPRGKAKSFEWPSGESYLPTGGAGPQHGSEDDLPRPAGVKIQRLRDGSLQHVGQHEKLLAVGIVSPPAPSSSDGDEDERHIVFLANIFHHIVYQAFAAPARPLPAYSIENVPESAFWALDSPVSPGEGSATSMENSPTLARGDGDDAAAPGGGAWMPRTERPSAREEVELDMEKQAASWALHLEPALRWKLEAEKQKAKAGERSNITDAVDSNLAVQTGEGFPVSKAWPLVEGQHIENLVHHLAQKRVARVFPAYQEGVVMSADENDDLHSLADYRVWAKAQKRYEDAREALLKRQRERSVSISRAEQLGSGAGSREEKLAELFANMQKFTKAFGDYLVFRNLQQIKASRSSSSSKS